MRDVCFVIVCFLIYPSFVPQEAVFSDCGIPWLSSHILASINDYNTASRSICSCAVLL